MCIRDRIYPDLDRNAFAAADCRYLAVIGKLLHEQYVSMGFSLCSFYPIRPGPVSYTHLDVYKRQVITILEFGHKNTGFSRIFFAFTLNLHYFCGKNKIYAY